MGVLLSLRAVNEILFRQYGVGFVVGLKNHASMSITLGSRLLVVFFLRRLHSALDMVEKKAEDCDRVPLLSSEQTRTSPLHLGVGDRISPSS